MRAMLTRSVPSLACLFLCVACSVSPVPPAAPTLESGRGLQIIGWLSGEWRAAQGGSTTCERWSLPEGNLMLGTSQTVFAGATRAFEFMRIEERPDAIVYVAQPNGKPATEFKMISVSPNEVTFENPQHDFPVKIIYRRIDADRMTARIEGKAGVAAEEWDFARTGV